VAQLKLGWYLLISSPNLSIHFCKEVAQLKPCRSTLAHSIRQWSIHFCKEVAQLKRINILFGVIDLLDYPFLQRSGSIET